MNVPILFATEPTPAQLGEWTLCALLILGVAAALVKWVIGGMTAADNRYTPRELHDLLEQRVKLLESEQRDRVREAVLNARQDKHMRVMQDFIDTVERTKNE